MKTLILIGLLFAPLSWAQEEETPVEVIQVLLDKTQTHTLEIEKDTFIPNIQGYACPIPAINVPHWFFFDARIRHGRHYRFGVKEEALEIKNPNMRFCNWPSPQSVFGEEFVVGKKLPITLRTLREIIEYVDHDGKTVRLLRERVSTRFLGQDLLSQGAVPL